MRPQPRGQPGEHVIVFGGASDQGDGGREATCIIEALTLHEPTRPMHTGT